MKKNKTSKVLLIVLSIFFFFALTLILLGFSVEQDGKCLYKSPLNLNNSTKCLKEEFKISNVNKKDDEEIYNGEGYFFKFSSNLKKDVEERIVYIRSNENESVTLAFTEDTLDTKLKIDSDYCQVYKQNFLNMLGSVNFKEATEIRSGYEKFNGKYDACFIQFSAVKDNKKVFQKQYIVMSANSNKDVFYISERADKIEDQDYFKDVISTFTIK